MLFGDKSSHANRNIKKGGDISMSRATVVAMLTTDLANFLMNIFKNSHHKCIGNITHVSTIFHLLF
jgi:hypothetical protein